MSYAYLGGPGQPDREILMLKGQAIAGHALGIVVIDIWYPLLPGNVANATTFDFPVLYHVLEGATIPQIISGDPALLDQIIEGAKSLVKQGARAIVGACGSFAFFQKEASAAIPVPTFLSVMLQVPLILRSLMPDQKLGVLAASETSITQRVFDQCGIEDGSRLAVVGAAGLQEFQKLLDCTGQFNSSRMESEIVERVRDFVGGYPEIGALLIQCSDLPPFAQAIQEAVRLPVFDMNTLINWVYQAVVRKPYQGFI